MKFKSTASYLLITFFMAAIVISFAFTGFTGFSSSTGAVAEVGSQKITISEYQRAYNAELQRFSQIFGGKSLTAAQIKQFRIKEGALNRLVQQKLVLVLAEEMDINVSTEEVKADIKQAEYFLTNNQFDVNKYRSLLQANGLTPSNFENMTVDTVKMKKMSDLFEATLVSKNSVLATEKIKESTATVNAVEVDKSKLSKFLVISEDKISKFADNKENKSIMSSLYNSMQNEFNKPQRVNARHILIKEDPKNKGQALKKAQAIRAKVTTKNFSKIAGKETEDPSGKGAKGGSLGWFSKGKMLPEFEKVAFGLKPGQISKPVKTSFGYHIIYVEKKDDGVTKSLDQVKNQIAKRHLQKTSRDDLAKFQKNIQNQLSDLLKANKTNKLEAMVKKYDLKLAKNAKVNAIDSKADQIALKAKDVTKILNEKNTSDVFVDDEATKITLYKAVSITDDKNILKGINTKIDEEVQAAAKDLSNQLQRKTLDYLKEGSKVVTYPNLL